MYLEQEAVFVIENVKKHTGNKKQSKKHWEKPENLIIKQKHIINQLTNK